MKNTSLIISATYSSFFTLHFQPGYPNARQVLVPQQVVAYGVFCDYDLALVGGGMKEVNAPVGLSNGQANVLHIQTRPGGRQHHNIPVLKLRFGLPDIFFRYKCEGLLTQGGFGLSYLFENGRVVQMRISIHRCCHVRNGFRYGNATG